MQDYFDIFTEAFGDYAQYLIGDILEPSWRSYFYALLALSAVVYLAELVLPWRRNQARIRRDFWLDGFYMFFNFFLFSLLGYEAIATVVAHGIQDLRSALGLGSDALIDVGAWPVLAQLALLLVVRDFLHYWIHRLLHRVPALWEFHKVHHSVREMGFAAHLRYHWMETVVYRSLEFLPLALIGFGVTEFFAVHLFALTVGHLNHANLRLPLGPLRYLLNSPQMHLWHHARMIPTRTGINFGLTLSVWDWVFGTAHWPDDDADRELGFEGVETFPSGFVGQLWRPFRVLFQR